MQGRSSFGGLVDVDLLLVDEQLHYFWRVMLDCELERRVAIDGEDGGVGAFDDEEGDDVRVVEVDGPMKRIPSAVARLVQQVLQLLPHHPVDVILVLAVGQAVQHPRYLLQVLQADRV